MTRVLRFFLGGTLVSAFALTLTALYWAFWPYTPQTHPPYPAHTSKPVYTAGERFSYLVEYCKLTDAHATVNRALVDGIRITFNPILSDLPLGCSTFNSMTLHIPEFTPPGKYYVDIITEFRVNPIRTVAVKYRTEEFEVIAAPNPEAEHWKGQIEDNSNRLDRQECRQ